MSQQATTDLTIDPFSKLPKLHLDKQPGIVVRIKGSRQDYKIDGSTGFNSHWQLRPGTKQPWQNTSSSLLKQGLFKQHFKYDHENNCLVLQYLLGDKPLPVLSLTISALGEVQLTRVNHLHSLFIQNHFATNIPVFSAIKVDKLNLMAKDSITNQGTIEVNNLALNSYHSSNLSGHITNMVEGQVKSQNKVDISALQIINKGLIEANGPQNNFTGTLIDNQSYAVWSGQSQDGKDSKDNILSFYANILKNQGQIEARQLKGRVKLFDNNQGRFHSLQTVEMTTHIFSNDDGSFSGMQGTCVTIADHLSNQRGQIGLEGKTLLLFKNQAIGQDLGTINGTHLYLSSKSSNSLINFSQGYLYAKEFVSLGGDQILLPEVQINSPRLYLNAQDFQLSPQVNSTRTIVTRTPQQNFKLTHPYTTTGTFEIRQKGLLTKKDVSQAMNERFGRGINPLPFHQHIIELQATVKADKGMILYTPSALFRLGDNILETYYSLLLEQGNLRAYASAFDIEKGTLATLNAYIYAPLGIHIGRLVKDPTREVFATFFTHSQASTCHSLGADISPYPYHFLGKEFKVYDGHHLLTLPVAVPNGTNFVVKGSTKFKGPLTHHGYLETQDLKLKSPKDHLCEAANVKVHRNFNLSDGGHFYLKRHIGQFNFVYYTTPHNDRIGGSETYSFATSDAASMSVSGKTSSHGNSTIFNDASIFYSFEKSPEINIIHQDYTSKLYQKFMTVTPQEKQRLIDSYVQSSGFFGRWNVSGITLPTNYIYYNNCGGYAVGFLKATNNFSGAQRVFAAYPSFANGVQIPAHTTQLQSGLSTPLILGVIGNGGLVLGSPNPYYIQTPDPIQNLVAKGFNLHTTYFTPGVKKLIEQATQPRFFFTIKERFWFDDNKAQNFYESIRQDIVVRMPDGSFKKPDLRALVSLSPKILVSAVQEQCQDVLHRGYLYDHQAIDESMVAQLHRNATQYINKLPSASADAELGQTLVIQGSRFPIPSDPFIFYLSLMNEEGVEELQPHVVFPPAMIEDALGKTGSKIRTKVLAIFPEGMTPYQMLMYFRHKPLLQKELLRFFQQNSKSVTYLNDKALAIQESQPVTTTDCQGIIPAVSQGDVLFQGEIDAGQTVAILPSNFTNHANLHGRDALLAALGDDHIIEPKVERVYINNGENFCDHIVDSQIATMQNHLYVFGGRDVILRGAQTHSGVLTYIEAQRNLIDQPIALTQQQVIHHQGRKRGTETFINVSQQSSHHSSGGHIVEQAGNVAILQARQVTAESISTTAPEGIYLDEAHNVCLYNANITEKGRWGRKSITQTNEQCYISQGSYHKVGEAHFSIARGPFKATNFNNTGKTFVNAQNRAAEFRLGSNHYILDYAKQSSNMAWQRSSQGHEGHYTYIQPTLGPVEINARNTHIELKKGEEYAYIYSLSNSNIPLVFTYLDDSYTITNKRTSGPSAAISTVAALAIAIATQGYGVTALSSVLEGVTVATGMQLSAAGIAMVNAGFSTICAQAGSSFIQQGNLTQVGKDLISANGIRSLGVTMLSAGLCQHIGSALDINMNPGLKNLINPEKQIMFSEFLQANALKTIVDTPLQCVIGQQPVEDAVLTGIKALGVNTVSSYFAYHIGKIYGQGKLNYVEHKALHGGVGAGAGWILNPTSKGLLSGAIGGIVSEVIMDERREIARDKAVDILAQAEKEGLSLEDLNFNEKYYDALSGELAFAKLGSASIAALLGQDASIAFATGTNAVENNAIMAAVGIGLATYEAYQIYKIYQEQGAYAALEKVAVEGVITIAGIGAVKGAYKIGKLSAPMAEAVWVAYVAENPAFSQVMSKVFAPLGRGLAKIKELYIKTDDALDTAWSNGIKKIGLRKSSSQTVDGLDLAAVDDKHIKGFYDLRKMEEYLNQQYSGNVSSTTLPELNAKNVKLAGQRHPETDIVFDRRGFPIFDDIMKFETKISLSSIKTGNARNHMREATKNLKLNILEGKINKNLFDMEQLKSIMSGKDRIPRLTWHHHQDIGRMQLIPRNIHKKTGHIGGMDLWYVR